MPASLSAAFEKSRRRDSGSSPKSTSRSTPPSTSLVISSSSERPWYPTVKSFGRARVLEHAPGDESCAVAVAELLLEEPLADLRVDRGFVVAFSAELRCGGPGSQSTG